MDFHINHLLIAMAIASYVLSHLIFSLNLPVQIAGVINKSKATASSVEHITAMAATFFTALFLPTVPYLVEQELSTEPFLLIISLSFLLSFCATFILRQNLEFFVGYFTTVISAFSSHRSMPAALLLRGKNFTDVRKNIIWVRQQLKPTKKIFALKYFLASMAATIPVSSGFFISFYLALQFSENRLFFSQLSIFIHGIGQIFMALYVVPAIMGNFDSSDSSVDWGQKVQSVILGREWAFLFLGLVALVSYIAT